MYPLYQDTHYKNINCWFCDLAVDSTFYNKNRHEIAQNVDDLS